MPDVVGDLDEASAGGVGPLAELVERAREHGAYISNKATHDGEEPYEINTTWWSAINQDGSDEPLALQVKRYVASRSIQ